MVAVAVTSIIEYTESLDFCLKYIRLISLTRFRLFSGDRVTRFSAFGGDGCRFFGGERLTAIESQYLSMIKFCL